MSSIQSEEQKKNRKAFSKTMKAQIKRKPNTEPINGKEYIYGLLQKKSESSLFNNERLLIIKGHESFGYASKLPQETLLPFLDEKAIPKCKLQVALDKLQINNDKQILIVQFKQQNKKQKTRWQFKCGSKVRAIEWRQKLQGAKNERILSLQNNSVKIILQDPNQNAQQSEMQNKNKIKIGSLNQQTKQQSSRIAEQGKPGLFNQFRESGDQKQKGNSKIMINQQQNQEKQFKLSNGKQQKFKDQNQFSSSRQQQNIKPASTNIFQSLLLSNSPNKQPLKTSKLNIDSSFSINEKAILKNKILDTDQENKPKQEFLKRKEEQNKTKNQIQEESNSFLTNVLKNISDSKFQIQKLKKQWAFQFAKANNQQQLIQHFKIYVQTMTGKIVDQLALEPKKRYYKPIQQNSQSIKYQIEGISIQFYLNQLNQVSSFQGKGSVISNKKLKEAYQQLKNYDYILQLTNNKGRIRVPLAMCVQYKGFIGFAKTMIPQSQSYENLESLQKQLDLLQAESRINNSVFQQGSNGRIIPLQNKIFQKIARSQNNFNQNVKSFDICYIEGLKHYLPQDFYKFNTQSGKNNLFTNNSSNVLRKQLIQDQEYQETVFCGQNMLNIVNRLKIPQHLKQGIQVLNSVSNSISQRVNALAIALENLDEVITNSKDLSNLMHGYGLNMRYLGLLLERSKQSWIKGILSAQIAARCAKYFFKLDLQDCILNLNESKFQNVRRFQVKQVVSFLNKLLGNTDESDTFWSQLTLQSQQNFQCYLDRSSVNVGFFIQSIQNQFRIKLTNIKDHKEKIFKVAEPFTLQNFSSFSIKSKTYDLSFTQLYTNINQFLKDPSQQSYQQLSIILNISRKGSLPSHFKLNQFQQKIILYLINWLPPSSENQIYYPNQINLGQILPSKTLYYIKLTQIKWLLKDKKEVQAQIVRDFIVQHVNKWLGQYHPILSQLYDLLSRYYLTSKTEEKRSITYCKSSIKNIEKLLSSSHIKLADNYYMLAQIYINYQRKVEGINSLKRAKEILEERQGEDSEAYGIIGLRMSEVLLATNKVEEALEQGVRSYMKLMESDDIQKYVQCMEVIGRCYEVGEMWDQYLKFSEQIGKNSQKLQVLSQNQNLFQRCIKIIILPHLHQLSKNSQICRQILSILSSFTSSHLSPSTLSSSYLYLKNLINSQSQSFPHSFISILNSELQQLLEEINSSGLMTRWKGFQNLINNKALLSKINSISNINAKGFQFLGILQALTVFTGESWIEGVIKSG